MKNFLILVSCILVGCTSYHPEKYIGEGYTQCWAAREKENCPVCNKKGRYKRSYSNAYPIQFLYYYSCGKHLWIIIEGENPREVHIIEKEKDIMGKNR